jgi:DnaJ-class molecular chaperone
MTELRECRVCGDSFEPDSAMRKLCEGCRGYGYRKTKAPGQPIRRIVHKQHMTHGSRR